MSLWKSAKHLNRQLFPQFESLKHGRLAKAYNLITDYKQAFKDLFVIVKTKPIRSAVQSIVLGGAIFANHKCPDMNSYTEHLLEASNEHGLISNLIRSRISYSEINTLMQYYSENRLTCLNFGVFSIIRIEPHSLTYDSVEKHCDVLSERWIYMDTWKKNVLDIGFLDRWYNLERIMLDYDVNEDEFPEITTE